MRIGRIEIIRHLSKKNQLTFDFMGLLIDYGKRITKIEDAIGHITKVLEKLTKSK